MAVVDIERVECTFMPFFSTHRSSYFAEALVVLSLLLCIPVSSLMRLMYVIYLRHRIIEY